MRDAGRLFVGIAIFFGLVAAVYWYMAREPAGTAALVFTGGLGFLVAFYLLFILGLMVFVIQPALASGNWLQALLAGLFFGLVTYATYDLTNLATVKDWPILITVLDLLWGSFVSGVTALLSFWIIRLF